MDEELKRAVEAARGGRSEAFQALLKLLRAAPAAVVKEQLASADGFVRRAAVIASKGRFDPLLTPELIARAKDSDVVVRRALAEVLSDEPGAAFDAAVEALLDDEDEAVRMLAAKAAKKRRALEAALLAHLLEPAETSWKVRQAAAEALAAHSPKSLPSLVESLAADTARVVNQAAAASAEALLKEAEGWPVAIGRPEHAVLESALTKLEAIGTKKFPLLADFLETRVATDVDVKKLRELGADLTAEAEEGRLPRAYGVDAICESLEKVLLSGTSRAAVLLGEPGTGKTAVVHELVHRLRNHPGGGYRVLRFSPVELLAGTKYLGEWQTKLNELMRQVKSPRRVILYCPNLQELSDAGRTSVSDINMATALAPRVESGEIAIVGESTPEAFRAGLGAIGSLRRLFHAVEVQEQDTAGTRAILEHMRADAGATVPGKVMDRLIELADYYLSGTSQPGRAAGLFRRVLENSPGATLGARDVLKTLSASTGVPVDLLDDDIALDQGKVRDFFDARVMGQSDAIDAISDVVTLVKAGLTDPGKPFGVFLFVGPTGVGKTELARALAEYLFGDPKRMIRFDMSEYATYDAYERLIGRGVQPGLLTAAVRERPFSVVLLDEIEKAHANVFDLCLQLFDAGRLTDAQGRTADFRRTIVILTSNVGSRVQEAPLGFGEGKGHAPTQDAILRELSRFFRPEFLNRLDRVVIFRPLALETAEKIARREVARVVERSGIARRSLMVDVEPAAIALLLKEGYSPHFGARPLKRTVERMVLLPVARAISAGTVGSGAVLRLIARGERIEVDAASMEVTADKPAKGELELSTRAAALAETVAALRTRTVPLASRKSELLAASGRPGFWDEPEAARAILDEVHRMEGVLSALDSLESAVLANAERARRKLKPTDVARAGERQDALEAEAARVAFLLACRDARDLGDAFVVCTLELDAVLGLSNVAPGIGVWLLGGFIVEWQPGTSHLGYFGARSALGNSTSDGGGVSENDVGAQFLTDLAELDDFTVGVLGPVLKPRILIVLNDVPVFFQLWGDRVAVTGVPVVGTPEIEENAVDRLSGLRNIDRTRGRPIARGLGSGERWRQQCQQ